MGGANDQRAHAAALDRGAHGPAPQRRRGAANRNQLSNKSACLQSAVTMRNATTHPIDDWQFNDIRGTTKSEGTSLRHLGSDARLEVLRGRLVAGSGYRTAPQEYRRQLARTGAILRLREKGCYHVHAAGVVDPAGRAWLICGVSGAGKSTLAYALARNGWRVLGDDGVIIREPASVPNTMMAHGWRDPVRVTVGAHAMFPELREPAPAGAAWSSLPGDARERAEIELSVARSAPVAAVIWIERSFADGSSAVHPIDALARLVAQSAWVLIDDQFGAAHLSALRDLARLPQFRLSLTADRLPSADETVLALVEGH